MNWHSLDLSLTGLSRHYHNGDFSPAELVSYLLARSRDFDNKNLWIRKLTFSELQPYLDRLEGQTPDRLPLYGVPFAIKDNIDLAGIPTTAACPAFSYVPEKHAFIVERLIKAGALPLGKTNMDQFATGLVGTRSPFGPCRNAYDDDYISGGSSSGSAVAVALDLVSFSIGTDTAGSGRVPAALNNIVGIKPTVGYLSTSGVVPACRTLDAVNFFTRNAVDAALLLELTADYDAANPFCRPAPQSSMPADSEIDLRRMIVGVPNPSQLNFFGDRACETAFAACLDHWKMMGCKLVEINFQPFVEAASLLYNGPWLTERYIAIKSLLEGYPDAIDIHVKNIIESARHQTAEEVFNGMYVLKVLKHQADHELAQVDFLLIPTVGVHYRIEEVMREPVELNHKLGYYTNFMNLLDLCAVAVPTGFSDDGLPFGVTLAAGAYRERFLLSVVDAWFRRRNW